MPLFSAKYTLKKENGDVIGYFIDATESSQIPNIYVGYDRIEFLEEKKVLEISPEESEALVCFFRKNNIKEVPSVLLYDE